ncbi:sugar phosphate nucleotidyltransferase [uncultured Ruminococcus sp.]|uniref:sugar phosphate nucleotidyltransferase n=2 Tax=uncultured Ruminococcus sp. TaxID=165186 RepID=UPI0025DE9D24|nr:sugar phosphate nucleotidyltransferase [uncultured Ruminococcus sp.]
MNIILLSGGSGLRLWPLSNSIRSKQFLKLFKTDNDSYESMAQRVYRQIRTVSPDIGITIATGEDQVSTIRNQLGNDVDICIEPCRRDTFPAIVLAAAYLHDIKGVDLSESIAVCPVDPYVDDDYYRSVIKLIGSVKNDSGKLMLLGVEPTYPSEKYGYIIPDNGDSVSHVRRFVEKPDGESAGKYIEQGALWNAGVFAFCLGYIIEKSHKLIEYTDYHDLLTKYESLEKISFDYAVSEKETNIDVMRYKGEWRDVGTWNMMSEVMSENVKGNALLDDKCENTHVINELGIPLLCMGCKNMIVAASNDGILVSEKEASGYMKPYVEKLGNMAMFAEKSWGTFTVLDVQLNSMTVSIYLKKGHAMKYHSHEQRSEIWTIVSGKGYVIVDDVKKNIGTGDTVSIHKGVKHLIYAESDMNIIEIQIGESINVKDKRTFPDILSNRS